LRETRAAKARVTKNDPKLVAAARELRDRYLEQINANQLASQGKYDVSRGMPVERESLPALPAPIAA
jgi:hypothetical protein